MNMERFRAEPLDWLDHGGRKIAISRARPRWAVLNKTAEAIVRDCDRLTGRRFADIRANFQSRFGPVASAELEGWLRALVEAGLLRDGADERDGAAPADFNTYRVEHVYIELLARCNLRCVHCFMGGAPERSEALEVAEVEALLDTFAGSGGKYVTLSGGEPLLYRHFEEVARHLSSLGLYGTTISNGTVLKPHRLALLDELGFNLAISIDGITPEVNRRIRGRDPAKAIDAIDRALDRLGPERVVLSFTPVKANLSEIDNLFAFVERKGIRRLNLSLYETVGRAVEFDRLLTLDDADRVTLMRAVYRQAIAWAGRVEIDFNDTRDVLSQFSADRTTAELHPLWRGVRVTSSGDVYPSSFGAVDRFRLGNIRTASFAELLGSETLRELYEALCDRDEKTAKCRDCTWRQICRGGSVASAYNESGEIYSPDAYCSAYLAVFPDVAVALAELATSAA